MSKYIRTPYRIYEYDRVQVIHPNWKQADTIEELCDECVVIDNNYELPFIRPAGFDDIPKSARAPWFIGEVLGAIWTDKGLIYVAKLNYKGEWELV